MAYSMATSSSNEFCDFFGDPCMAYDSKIYFLRSRN